MTRTYKSRKPYGKRGSYQPRESWSPRRASAVAAKSKAKSASASAAAKKKKSCSLSSRPRIVSPSRFVGEYGLIRNAITLAMNKLLLKPKYNCTAQPARRLRFWTVGFEECLDYMRNHPAACKLPKASQASMDLLLPGRATFYRILNDLGWTKENRTRSQKRYPRTKQNI